jgi:hypothetical protein
MALRAKSDFALDLYEDKDGDIARTKLFATKKQAFQAAEGLILSGDYQLIIAYEGDASGEYWVEFNRFRAHGSV